jgi:hypothetical protein
MPVGNQSTQASINGSITSCATTLRDACQAIKNLSTQVNGQANGLAYLESIEYSSAANPNNPNGISDAQLALNVIAYLNTVAGVYFGTATQGTAFNFDQELSQAWGI